MLVALRSPHPARLLVCFLAGGLLTCVAVGTAAALALQRSSVVTRSRPPADPVVYLAGGLAALAVAFVLRRRAPGSSKAQAAQGPSLYERALRRGAALSFVAGIVLNLVPGVFPLIALKDIAQLGYGAVWTATVVTAFYLVMFALIEVPLIGYVAAPQQTAAATERANRWLSENGRRLIVVVLEIAAAVLFVRATIAFFR